MTTYHLKCGKSRGLPATKKDVKESGIPCRVVRFSSELKCDFCEDGPRGREPLYILEESHHDKRAD